MSGDGKNTNEAISAEEKKYITDHEYDGIREFDFPLPNWWIATFVITVVFGVIYWVVYTFNMAPSLNEELAHDLEANKQVQEAQAAASGQKPEEVLAELQAALADVKRLALGKTQFTEKCAACHGPQGQGQIGPNLTDDHWINGKATLPEIHKIVSEGVAEKGMPPWGAVLKPDELISVVAYVKSIRGSNPPNPKAPQGELVKE